MRELIYKDEARRAVLHNQGDAAVAAIDEIKPVDALRAFLEARVIGWDEAAKEMPGGKDLLQRSHVKDVATQIFERCEQLEVANVRGGRHKKEVALAIRETAETFMRAIEDPEILPAEDAERRVYSYLKIEGNYRHMFCDERITCANCGFTRPMLRGEQILRCQNCGAYYTGAGI